MFTYSDIPYTVSDSVPVQNQAAAQKLRQKMVNPNQEGQSARRSRHRGKGKQEEESVLTLDEWERRKGRSKPLLTTDEVQVLDRDEDLAWQIQQQFDLEDSHVSIFAFSCASSNLLCSSNDSFLFLS